MTPTHTIKSDKTLVSDIQISYPTGAEKTCLLRQDGELVEFTESMLIQFVDMFKTTKELEVSKRCSDLYILIEKDMMQPGPINDAVA